MDNEKAKYAERAATELRAALQHAGLPTEPREIIGRVIEIYAEEFDKEADRPNYCLAYGTVTGIDFSNQLGLQLGLSMPGFYGCDVYRLEMGELCIAIRKGGASMRNLEEEGCIYCESFRLL